ncbi:MAG: hypothetical protein HOC77_04865 [Chloroflexi bacterium]|jgi:hypothetical protein|nr:hypothetical protein [Chloroflexota bacterium]MBT4073228.1 hypothetical protein [Chloroflexota bacterium]MBT4514409.1 hypothetical protein [Chloroflexota bacterium]MBT5320397.1 hypothetical protein [Chloroflexota bacterium]MBT6681825.1 hypothetical protein [Chloroflexota bacterium]
MIQRQSIECFGCQTPVDETDLSCAYCGNEIALEIAERDAVSFLLRCTSVAILGGAAMAAFGFGYFLTGIDGHEKTFLLSALLTVCISGLVWFASETIRPTRVEN